MDAWAILSGLVLDDDRLWGDAATKVQLDDANAVINGTVPNHFITRARGYSKTQDNAGIAAACALTAPPNSRLYWAAADAEQGELAIDSIRGFQERTPILNRALDVQSRRVKVLETGTTIDIVPADSKGAWGKRPYMGFVDEIAQWGETPEPMRLWQAITTAMLKVKGARLVVMTTSGDPRHWSHREIEVARKSKLWRVSETRGPAPWSSEEALEDQRRRLPESVYANLFENQWVEAEGAFFGVEAIEECFTLDGPTHVAEPGRQYIAALDLGHVNDRSVFAIGHRDASGRLALDQMKVWTPSKRRPVSFGEVEAFIQDAHATFGFELIFDPAMALQLTQNLEGKGVQLRRFNFSQGSKTQLASAFLEAVNGRTLALYRAEGLADELRALRVRPLSNGGYTFDHQTGKNQHDDRATVLAMLALHASEHSGEIVTEQWLDGVSDEFVYQSGDLTLVGDQYRDLDTHPVEDSWL